MMDTATFDYNSNKYMLDGEEILSPRLVVGLNDHFCRTHRYPPSRFTRRIILAQKKKRRKKPAEQIYHIIARHMPSTKNHRLKPVSPFQITFMI